MSVSHARVLMQPPDDNAALLRACRAGDPDAWETLVRRYQRLIFAIPRRAGLSDDQAADVFQRVCVRLFEHLDRIDQPERLGAWLATTARRESWRLLRQEGGARRLDLSDDDENEILQIADSAVLPDEQLELLERQQIVQLALNELDERCRNLLSLLFFRAEPAYYAEVAAILGLPEGSIGPTRARCLRKLERILEEYEL